MLLLAEQIFHPSLMPPQLAYVLILVWAVAIMVLSSVVFLSISKNKIIYFSSEQSTSMVMTDCLLVLIMPSQGTIWEHLFLLVWTMMTIYSSLKTTTQIHKSMSDKLMGFISFFKIYLLILLIANTIIYSKGVNNEIFLATSPVILFLILYFCFDENKETLDPKIFEGKAQLKDFLRFIYLISDELYIVKSNLNIPF